MTDIAQLRAEMLAKRNTVALLDGQLRDYYQRKRRLQNDIARTFPHVLVDRFPAPAVVVTRYTREGAPARAQLFIELDRLGIAFAPITKQRRDLHIEAESLARAIERMEAAKDRRRAQTEMEF